MTVSLIAAMARNRVIGRNNALPWSMPADLTHFRALTRGKPVIMGRKTFESIGHPLQNRKNIIITHDPQYRVEGCAVVHSPAAALAAAGNADEIMIIGGEKIFREFMPRAQKMYLTMIDADIDGDTQFPKWNPDEWQETSREPHAADEKNPHSYTFLTLQKK